MPSNSSKFVAVSPVDVANVLSESSLHSLHGTFSSTLKECLRSVNRNGSKDSSCAKIYAGLAGVSHLNFHLSTAQGPITPESRAKLLLVSQQQLSDTISSSRLALSIPASGSKVAFLDTSTGPATLVLLYQLHHFVTPRAITSAQDVDPPPFDKLTVTSAADVLSAATIVALQPVTASEFPEDGCELLYGRAGLLYALLLLRQAFQSDVYNSTSPADGDILHIQVATVVKQLTCRSILKKLADDLVHRGKIGSQDYREDYKKALEEDEICPSLMWCWHGKRYLGGAHGVAGILHVLLHLPQDIIAPHFETIMQTVTYLLSLQDPHTGNWPSKAMSLREIRRHAKHRPEDLVQWCHGAPGIIPLLSTLVHLHTTTSSTLSIAPDLLHAVLDSMHKASTLVMTAGLLRKGPGLCHGVAGNASALLSAADTFSVYHHFRIKSSPAATCVDTKDYAALARECTAGALNLLRCYIALDVALSTNVTTTQLAEPSDRKVVFRTPDRPWSLYEGYGGLCAVLGEALRRLDELIASAHSAESEARDRHYDERGVIQKGSSMMLGYCDLRLCT